MFKKLKLIHIIRDPRNIYISKKAVTKINGRFSTSIFINSYIWVKILNEIEQIKKKYTKRTKLLSMRILQRIDLILKKKSQKFLNLNKNYSKNIFCRIIRKRYT